MAAYSIKAFNVSGAVGGGAASIQITMDNRFCSLISYAAIQIAQGTAADAGLRWLINGDTIASIVDTPTANSVPSGVTSFEVGNLFQPPPVILPGSENTALTVFAANVDGDEYFLDAFIFLFDIRARELTPMGPLLWARGST